MPGDFLKDDFPANQDVICLVRVLYDHKDSTVELLLKRIYDALPRWFFADNRTNVWRRQGNAI